MTRILAALLRSFDLLPAADRWREQLYRKEVRP